MALDPRGFPRLPSSSDLKSSSASMPSLRSRESVMPPSPHTPNGGSGVVSAGGGNVRVVVRVRAFLPREISRNAPCLIRMNPSTQATTLLVPSLDPTSNAARNGARKVIEEKHFTFDNSFWSHDRLEGNQYAEQEDVYNSLGEDFLDHNFEGYHTCIFAYGQTGSGKSYTMMGTPTEPGLIPRTCEDLFQRIESNQSPSVSYTVRVSYFEVYNEHVRDLLVPRQDPPFYLKIRESPTEGPYVKDLTDVPVKNLDEIMRYMKMGDSSRTTASTKMNDTSSRSHAVFTIILKQIHHDMDTDETTERNARIRLVDLAGSERAKATEARGQRLREGSNINKSLTTLGRVIAALASDSSSSSSASSMGTPRLAQSVASPGRGSGVGGGNGSPRKAGPTAHKEIVPYRDSILTWLLKDSLGGNSKTAMIACISPCDYDETLSTLRYANQAKRIRTRAIVNQDHVSAAERDAQIAEMQDTIRTLQLSISQHHQQQQVVVSVAATTLREHEVQTGQQLEEYQKQVDRMQRLMQETRQVSECKIRGLQTENEALRLHLKLAVDSIRNPIPVIAKPGSIIAEDDGNDGDDDDDDGGEDKENEPQSPPFVGGRKKTITPTKQKSIVRGASIDGNDNNQNVSRRSTLGETIHDDGGGGEMVANKRVPMKEIIIMEEGGEEEEEEDEEEGYGNEKYNKGGIRGRGSANTSASRKEDPFEIRTQLDSLLADLSLYRMKIKDDHSRFN